MSNRYTHRLLAALSATAVLLTGVAVSGCGSEPSPAPIVSNSPAASEPAPAKKVGKGRSLGPQPGSADYTDKPGKIPRGK